MHTIRNSCVVHTSELHVGDDNTLTDLVDCALLLKEMLISRTICHLCQELNGIADKLQKVIVVHTWSSPHVGINTFERESAHKVEFHFLSTVDQ